MMKVIIPLNTRKTIISALAKAKKREIGGILIGEICDPVTLKLINATTQPTGSPTFFLRNWGSKEKKELNKILKQSGNIYQTINYCGEWHSHPVYPLEPSNQDIQSMWDLCFDIDNAVEFLVLLIVHVRRGDSKFDCECYYFGKSFYPDFKQIMVEYEEE